MTDDHQYVPPAGPTQEERRRRWQKRREFVRMRGDIKTIKKGDARRPEDSSVAESLRLLGVRSAHPEEAERGRRGRRR